MGLHGPATHLRVKLFTAPGLDKPVSKLSLFVATDEGGYASFRDIPVGTYWLSTDPDLPENDWVQLKVTPLGPRSLKTDLRWPPRKPLATRTLSGTLRTAYYYPNFKEIPMALDLVEFSSGRVIETAYTDDQGHFQFDDANAPGLYEVKIQHDQNYDSGDIFVEKSPSATPVTLDLNLSWTDCGISYALTRKLDDLRLAEICGIATFVDSQPVQQPNGWLFAKGDTSRVIEHVVGDAHGNFSFQTTAQGDYILVVGWRPLSPFVANVRIEPRATPVPKCARPLHIALDMATASLVQE